MSNSCSEYTISSFTSFWLTFNVILQEYVPGEKPIWTLYKYPSGWDSLSLSFNVRLYTYVTN